MSYMLFSQMEPPPGWEDDFHDWYESEHIPDRLALDGFDAATRYEALEGGPMHLAVYEIGDLGVLDTPAYRRLKEQPTERTGRMLANVRGFTRFTCELTSDSAAGDGSDVRGDYLSVVAFEVPDEDVEAFDDWYENEHVAALLKADSWLRVRRWRVLSGDGGPWTHLALHELADLDVMDSPERAAARVGPKRDALAGREWFQMSGRWLYRVLNRHL